MTCWNRVWGLLLGVALIGCSASMKGPGGEGDHESSGPTDDRVLIEASKAAKDDVADFLQTTGTLESEAQADLVPEATGVVREVLVEEGQTVKKGEVLAVIVNPSLEAGASRAGLELEQARQERDNARVLHTQGAISDRELTQAEQALRAAETGFSEAAGTHGFTRITSPIDGIIAVRDLRVGELAGGRRAFQVVQLDHLRVVVSLPERDLSRVAVGQSVLLRSAYDAKASAGGTIDRISPVVDPLSGTVRVTVAVDPSQKSLRPGQFVRVGIELARHSGVVTIAREALVYDDGDPIAWRVIDSPPDVPKDDDAKKEDGHFWDSWFAGDDSASDEAAVAAPTYPRRQVVRVPLTLGYVNDDEVEVSAGLNEDDLVVTTGASNLREGVHVRLPEDPAPVRKDPDDKKKDAEKDP